MIEMKAVLAGNKAFRHIEEVRSEWKKALLAEGKDIKKEYEKTTATWSHHVTFNIRPHVSGRVNWYVEVFAKNRIYWFVHESIKVMRGVLSSDWSPKTQPGVLSSGAGSGRLLYASKKVNKPPYEARKFTDEIVKVRQKPFEERMRKATRVGARAATQGG
jgi:hypothetical protein